MSLLFSPASLGPIMLQNRMVMAPMTRSRATGNIPTALMAEYYAQRSSAGLIITEGTSSSPNGLGYPRIPGIFSPSQVEGWKAVTEAVHEGGAKMFLQLMHCGRIAHQLNLPAGARVIAPSAVAASGEMYTDADGLKPFPIPEAMSGKDITDAVAEYARAAENAVSAGFDGVELHAANGYLLEQFIRPNSNRRTDRYGGSLENRARFLFEVTAAVSEAIGRERVGIRLSPFGVFNDMPLYDNMEEEYAWLATELNRSAPAYLHIVDHSSMGAPVVPESIKATFRREFRGALILSGGYDATLAESDLERGRCDLVAFGRAFIANPDLVKRWKTGAPLNTPDMDTFYTPGEKGYTDYPAAPL
ncbi:alkene reductase [Chlorobium sp. BLA1]|uniref:alkene reductase n=1 Tax=Candidatus Chlorobium masyuteum TaxID=2716876 RepID=UPI001423E33F|nr:alkene reductase [Candidatus Chlorobium masyuteum]NHQ61047.1 alkene reductase [Candidatus Chlorobium masyuteum]